MDLVGALAVEINGGATCDPVKPGGEAAARIIEGTRRTPYLQEDILDQLLRRGAVTQDLQAHTEDRAAIAIVELGEGYLDFRSIQVGHELLVRWFIRPLAHLVTRAPLSVVEYTSRREAHCLSAATTRNVQGVIRGKLLLGFRFCLRGVCLLGLRYLGQNRPGRSSVEPFTRQKRLKVPIKNRGEKMHQPLRHIEDTVTSVVVLLVLGVMGFFGLVVLMLTLALGF